MVIIGAVMRPQEKNWRNTATTACQVEGCLKLHRVIVTGSGNFSWIQITISQCILILGNIYDHSGLVIIINCSMFMRSVTVYIC